MDVGFEKKIYRSRKWKKKREEVIAFDKGECQRCKAKGRYRRAAVVHHVRHLREFPELAFELFITDEQGNLIRQLVSLCTACHDAEHPERLKQCRAQKPVTEERWD